MQVGVRCVPSCGRMSKMSRLQSSPFWIPSKLKQAEVKPTPQINIDMSSKTADLTVGPANIDTPKLPDRFADESYKLFSQVSVDNPTSEEAARIRKKLIKWILPVLCVGYHLMYVDKQTVCVPSFGDSS